MCNLLTVLQGHVLSKIVIHLEMLCDAGMYRQRPKLQIIKFI